MSLSRCIALALLACVVPLAHGVASIPPSISKAFSPSTTGVSVVSRLTFTITNPNPTDRLHNIRFQDTYPAGLVNANPANITNTCGGDATAGSDVFGGVAGGNTIGLQGNRNDLANGATCQLAVDVVSATPGTYNNTSGAVTGCTNNGCVFVLTGNTANASLVVSGPGISKSFSPGAIGSGGVSVLTLTLSNSTGGAMTGAAFTDTFPTSSGAVTLADATTTNTCGGTLSDDGGGSINAGDAGIRLTGGTIPAGGSCAITVNVTATVAGTHVNTIPAGGLTAVGGSNQAAASATLVVSPPVTVVKSSTVISDPLNGAASPKRIPGAVVEYTITISNAGSPLAADGVVVSDAIPGNTTFVAGSLVVDGVSEDDNAGGADESDPNGADFGVSAANAVTLRIGTIAAGGSKAGSFRVTVD